ncbi:MAG: hypothetical protein GY711_10125 [bacterium]|nr:hypothetical protein [bacterium]
MKRTDLFAGLLTIMALSTPASAQVGKGLLDPNVATDKELTALPGMTETIVKALIEKRPFAGAQKLDEFLGAQKLDEDARKAFYAKAFVHVNLNTADSKTMQLIPGVGKRMAHEFDEYRPWKSWKQFDKEIGKYVKEGSEPAPATLDGKRLRYEHQGAERWWLDLDDLKIVGECTTDLGPVAEDWFLVFVAGDPPEFLEAPVSSLREVIPALAGTLGKEPWPGLIGETGYASRVLWPPELEGEELFDYARAPRRKLADWLVPPIARWLSAPVIAYLEPAGSDPKGEKDPDRGHGQAGPHEPA